MKLMMPRNNITIIFLYISLIYADTSLLIPTAEAGNNILENVSICNIPGKIKKLAKNNRELNGIE